MSIVIIIVFLIVSLLHAINLHILLGWISKKHCKFHNVSLCIYLISALLCIISEQYYTNNIFRLLIFSTYIISFIYCSQNSFQSLPLKVIIYTSLLYLISDSILQSSLYLCFEPLLSYTDQNLTMRCISLFINIFILALLNIKQLRQYAESLIINFNIVSSHTYILILISLILSGSLLENQLVDVNQSGAYLQNKITKALATICIPLLILIIISLLFNCITKSYYQNTSSLLEKQINMQLDYYNKLEKKNSELREFRHDFKNHMLCLQSLIDNHDCEEASQYIQKITNRSYSEPAEFYTGNKIADAILADKSALASEINAEISFDGEIFDGISAPDICIILSNALDNAIEACAKISHTNKSISVKCIFSKGVQIINISNPTIDTDNITENSFHTTKDDKDNHGYGLYNIKKTVDMYNGMFSINCTGGIFTLEVGLNVAAHISQGL